MSLVNLPNRVQICLFSKSGRLVPSSRYQKHDNFENSQIGTLAWWTRVPCEVPDSTKLGYQSGYFQNYHALVPRAWY